MKKTTPQKCNKFVTKSNIFRSILFDHSMVTKVIPPRTRCAFSGARRFLLCHLWLTHSAVYSSPLLLAVHTPHHNTTLLDVCELSHQVPETCLPTIFHTDFGDLCEALRLNMYLTLGSSIQVWSTILTMWVTVLVITVFAEHCPPPRRHNPARAATHPVQSWQILSIFLCKASLPLQHFCGFLTQQRLFHTETKPTAHTRTHAVLGLWLFFSRNTLHWCMQCKRGSPALLFCTETMSFTVPELSRCPHP